MGRLIIQYYQDLVAVQEIIWDVGPDLIIKISWYVVWWARFFASLFYMNAQCSGPKDAEVLCVEIDLHAHNCDTLVSHPMYQRSRFSNGSSVDKQIASDIAKKPLSASVWW